MATTISSSLLQPPSMKAYAFAAPPASHGSSMDNLAGTGTPPCSPGVGQSPSCPSSPFSERHALNRQLAAQAAAEALKSWPQHLRKASLLSGLDSPGAMDLSFGSSEIASLRAMHPNPFVGRCINAVNDLSIEEQLYLYGKARIFKEAIRSGKDVEDFRLVDSAMAIYLLFMAPSKRMKSSYLRAAQFHRVKVNDFDAEGSSFNKKETVTDCVKMLTGYSTNTTIFVLRSVMEGTSQWLREEMNRHCPRMGLPIPAFINAGDGSHGHPTHEYLDIFSFLEQLNWRRDFIHLALVGDLFHSRTIRSKADGLRVFKEVHIDLVAPRDLQLADPYVQKMERNGFHVRIFGSVAEYLESGLTATVWYFTKLHWKKFGDRLKDIQNELTEAVTFREEWASRLAPSTKFYHPGFTENANDTNVRTIVPRSLATTSLNAWDEQASNGYFVQCVLLGMIGGKIGADYINFVEIAPIFPSNVMHAEDRAKQGIKQLQNGAVLDHIAMGESIENIWAAIAKVRKYMHFDVVASHGVFECSGGQKGKYKGLISIPDMPPLSRTQLKRLAVLAPESTINIIQDGEVRHKYRLHMPPYIYNFADVHCKNTACISHPSRFEHVSPYFKRLQGVLFACKYCETVHTYDEIWS